MQHCLPNCNFGKMGIVANLRRVPLAACWKGWPIPPRATPGRFAIPPVPLSARDDLFIPHIAVSELTKSILRPRETRREEPSPQPSPGIPGEGAGGESRHRSSSLSHVRMGEGRGEGSSMRVARRRRAKLTCLARLISWTVSPGRGDPRDRTLILRATR